MNAQEIWVTVESGEAVVLDVRPPHAYSQGHIPSSVSAPYSRQGWGGAVKRWMGSNPMKVVLFGDNAVVVDAAQKALQDENVNFLAAWEKGTEEWMNQGLPIVEVQEITVDDLHQTLNDYVVIDVREPYEWRSGIIPGALKIPLGQLAEHVSKLDRDNQYAVVCAHGNRSQSGASFLADNGLKAGSVVGGMALWLGAGHPVDR